MVGECYHPEAEVKNRAADFLRPFLLRCGSVEFAAIRSQTVVFRRTFRGQAIADGPELLTRVPVLVDNSDIHSQNTDLCGLLFSWSLLFHLYFLFIHCADFITQEQLNA